MMYSQVIFYCLFLPLPPTLSDPPPSFSLPPSPSLFPSLPPSLPLSFPPSLPPSLSPSFSLPKAYPIPNRTIKAIKTHTARLNTNVTMPCVFSPGVLSQRYSIQWFNGLSTINTTDSRLSITSDFSLVINNVNALDASSAYYCVVDVENDFFSYHSIGPSVELLVTGE